MKLIFTTIIIVCISICTKTKLFSSQQNTCDIFLNKGDIRDTVVIKANFIGIVELPQGHPPLIYLEKKGILESKDFCSIIFTINGCTSDYNIVCGDNSVEGLKILNSGIPQPVSLTCVIFRDNNIPKYSNKPFAIVTKVRKVN